MVSAQVMWVQAPAGMGEGTTYGSCRPQELSLLLSNIWPPRSSPCCALIKSS